MTYSKLKDHQRNNIIILGLASWRLANALVNEVGPFNVFVKIRELSGIKHDVDNNPISWEGENVLSCVWCTSFWTSIIMYFAPKPIKYFFAGSALAILIGENVVKRNV